ncbi:MAG: uracil-DNA glycosylase [Pseudomonadota bacterium]|uniref:Type-4 uracil-DNA glycosylase n=1 Tax=Candidatus Desulfatibia profunda TaxID=2841695 RepID=A0A8J6NSJ2_9BACT|nr:uracil-DNA glycosylase [Candidatus Desulfatibia profunda]MBL7179339.1 uracil-DNA glycosylase [Desulfobacterales bacterium]MBU0699028.1 uracil-DNA glycosylase [Pseudomonadota bacterium]
MPTRFRHSNTARIDDFIAAVAEINNTLRYLAETGCRGFDCSEESLKTISNWGRKAGAPPETLSKIRDDLGDCRRCKLSGSRNNIVFGSGDPHARLVFVGEGPGYEEDQKGEPFVGAAGQLLTKIIQAINYSREQVYIGNIIKCRPPGNRNPMPDEITACAPFLKRQIAAIKPDFICALGTFAARTLLETNEPISKLRGSFHQYMGIRVLPTYHPAFLLRNPEKKRDVWEDMKMLMKALGRSIS